MTLAEELVARFEEAVREHHSALSEAFGSQSSAKMELHKKKERVDRLRKQITGHLEGEPA